MKPVSAQKAPFAKALKAGDYWWYACGQWNNQPFCDSSHNTTEFTPQKFTLIEDKEVWLWGCKHSGTKPFCDGSHKKLV